MLADLRYEYVDSVMTAALSGDVDMSNADEIGTALVGALDNEALGLVLDLSSVDYFDSAGIRLLYDLRHRLQMRGQQLRIVIPPGSNVRDALHLAAVLQTMEVAEDTRAAISTVVGTG